MGCCSSKKKTNSNSVIFKVTNIDQCGKKQQHGQIEITDFDLIMHYAGEKSFVPCPLRTVRRYGYEDFMFCFEAGRSSPIGEGVFAFRSKEAEKIFKTFQERLQIREGINVARDMSAEVHFYVGQDNELKEDYDEVSFSGSSGRYNSLNNIESPYLELEFNNPFSPYANLPNANVNNDELIDNGGTHSSPPKEETITYTEVEIAVSKNKKVLPKSLTMEVSDYTLINFEQTLGLRNLSRFTIPQDSMIST